MKHAWIALALWLVMGCKNDASSSGSDKVASCNQPSLQSCREYRGDNLALGTKNLEKLCSVLAPGEFKPVACPTAGVIATCTKPDGKDFFYTGYALTSAELEKTCTDVGGKLGK